MAFVKQLEIGVNKLTLELLSNQKYRLRGLSQLTHPFPTLVDICLELAFAQLESSASEGGIIGELVAIG